MKAIRCNSRGLPSFYMLPASNDQINRFSLLLIQLKELSRVQYSIFNVFIRWKVSDPQVNVWVVFQNQTKCFSWASHSHDATLFYWPLLWTRFNFAKPNRESSRNCARLNQWLFVSHILFMCTNVIVSVCVCLCKPSHVHNFYDILISILTTYHKTWLKRVGVYLLRNSIWCFLSELPLKINGNRKLSCA